MGMLQETEQMLRSLLRDPKAPLSVAQTLPQNATSSTPKMMATNGMANGNAAFAWKIETITLRDEIASLSGMDPSDVDEDTSVFALGLDSIDVIKLSSRLKQHGLVLSVTSIMKHPSIAEMSEKLVWSRRSPEVPDSVAKLDEFDKTLRHHLEAVGEDTGNIEQVLPVTPLQEGMLAEMVKSNYALYFNHDILKLRKSTSLQKLKRAWFTVIEGSPILRTEFHCIEDPNIPYTYAQVIQRKSQVRWRTIDARNAGGENNVLQQAMESATNDARKNGHILSLTAVRFSGETYLVFSIAHALYDGWSLGLLHEDVQRAYVQEYIARPSYNSLLAEISEISSKDAADFWKESLSGIQTRAFPRLQGSAARTSGIVHREEHFSAVGAETILRFCKSTGITAQTLGQTCWGLLLAHYLGQLDVVFGTVLSGRTFESADEMVFPLMNTVPLRVIVHGSYANMLRHLQEHNAQAIQYQHFPLRQTQRLIGNGKGSLFDTFFIHQHRISPQNASQNTIYDSVGGSSDVEVRIQVRSRASMQCS